MSANIFKIRRQKKNNDIWMKDYDNIAMKKISSIF